MYYKFEGRETDSEGNISGYLLKNMEGKLISFRSYEIKEMLKGGNYIEGADLVGDNVVFSNSGEVGMDEVRRGFRASYGEKLHTACSDSLNYKPRDVVEKMLSIVSDTNVLRSDIVCIISGIRRTGKTTAIHHTIQGLIELGYKEDNILYIEIINDNANIQNVYDYIENFGYNKDGEVAVFIDEATKIVNFVDDIKLISDGVQGKIVVMAGTDNYAFEVAKKDTLLGRSITLHTNTIDLREYVRIFSRELGGLSKEGIIAKYMEDGSLAGNRELRDREVADIVRSGVVDNIVNTVIRNLNTRTINGEHVELLKRFSKTDLAYLFTVVILKSCQLHGKREIRNIDIRKCSLQMIGIDEGSLSEQLVKSNIDKRTFSIALKILEEVGVIRRVYNSCYTRSIEGVKSSSDMQYYVRIAGLYNSIIRRLYRNSEIQEKHIFAKVLETMVMESIAKINGRYDYKTVEFIRFTDKEGKDIEIDIVVTVDESVYYKEHIERRKNSILIEVKSSKKPKKGHAKHLWNKDVQKIVPNIGKRYIVYMGETIKYGELQYINAYDFLVNIEDWI